MLKHILAALAIGAASVSYGQNIVGITYNWDLDTITFDFSLESGYFDAQTNSSQSLLGWGSAGGAFSGPQLIENNLVDRFGVAVPDAPVDMFIRYYESGELLGLGVGSYTGGGADFTIGGGSISYNADWMLTASSVAGFETSSMAFGSFVGTDAFSVSTTAVPEPSTYALLAGIVTLGAVIWRKRARSKSSV